MGGGGGGGGGWTKVDLEECCNYLDNLFHVRMISAAAEPRMSGNKAIRPCDVFPVQTDSLKTLRWALQRQPLHYEHHGLVVNAILNHAGGQSMLKFFVITDLSLTPRLAVCMLIS